MKQLENQQERLQYLIDVLMQENPEDGAWLQKQYGNSFKLLRGLMNLRPPKPCNEEFLTVQDAYLQQMTQEKGIVNAELLTVSAKNKHLTLWQGDITRLKADAIVNAANSQMLGCWEPNHGCIDNIIHTMSGVQLRRDCAALMEQQGYDEPTGKAKITPAYNLPSSYVLHTVGPIVRGSLTDEHRTLLRSSYQSCLELAAEYNLKSVAFCCISTGVFGFPNQPAAEIAVDTALKFLENDTSVKQIIFNVFKDEDKMIYEELLGECV